MYLGLSFSIKISREKWIKIGLDSHQYQDGGPARCELGRENCWPAMTSTSPRISSRCVLRMFTTTIFSCATTRPRPASSCPAWSCSSPPGCAGAPGERFQPADSEPGGRQCPAQQGGAAAQQARGQEGRQKLREDREGGSGGRRGGGSHQQWRPPAPAHSDCSVRRWDDFILYFEIFLTDYNYFQELPPSSTESTPARCGKPCCWRRRSTILRRTGGASGSTPASEAEMSLLWKLWSW